MDRPQDASQDVEWMSAVFDEAAIDFEVLSLITPSIFLTENLRGIVGQELAFLMNNHIEIEGNYSAFMKEHIKTSGKSSMASPGNKGTDDNLDEDEVNEMVSGLTDSLRSICRMFRKTPYMLKYVSIHIMPSDSSSCSCVIFIVIFMVTFIVIFIFIFRSSFALFSPLLTLLIHRYLRRDDSVIKEPWFNVLSHLAEYFQIVKRKVSALCNDDYVNPDKHFDELEHTFEEAILRQKELRKILKAEKGERELQKSQGRAKIEKLSLEINKLREEIDRKEKRINSEKQISLQEVEFGHERAMKNIQEEQEYDTSPTPGAGIAYPHVCVCACVYVCV